MKTIADIRFRDVDRLALDLLFASRLARDLLRKFDDADESKVIECLYWLEIAIDLAEMRRIKDEI